MKKTIPVSIPGMKTFSIIIEMDIEKNQTLLKNLPYIFFVSITNLFHYGCRKAHANLFCSQCKLLLVTQKRRGICAKHGLVAGLEQACGIVLGLFSSPLHCLALSQAPACSKAMGFSLALLQATYWLSLSCKPSKYFSEKLSDSFVFLVPWLQE